jgi:integral membrane protein (TIGR00529 family)
MTDVLKIILVLAVIVFLLKKKWALGIVMAVSSVILAMFYLMRPLDFLKAFIEASTDKTTILLLITLLLIRVFENIMRKNGIMQQMMDSFRSLVRDRRIVMASMPAIIGLLPSMGGALFSAPLVEEASKGTNISPEKKAFINYVFRHPWEYISPLYPGLILASAITIHSVRDLIISNIPYAVFLVIGGTIWGLTGLDVQKDTFNKLSRKGLLSFLPIGAIILLFVVLNLDLSISLAIVIIALYIVMKYTPARIFDSIKESFSWEILFIILGVMTFKEVLNVSGAVTNLSSFFSSEGIPILIVLFILPFLSGLLTGLTIGFVGAIFPILIGIEGAQSLSAISFAFASGYVGVLLSPVHLCLVLTREHFKAGMSDIYRHIVKVGILIMLVALIEYFILTNQ